MEIVLREWRRCCSTAAACLRGSFPEAGSPQEEIARRGAADAAQMWIGGTKVHRDGLRTKSGGGDELGPGESTWVFPLPPTESLWQFNPGDDPAIDDGVG